MSRTVSTVQVKQEYMTTRELATYLGLTIPAVRRMVDRKTIPVHKFKNNPKFKWFFKISEIEGILGKK